MVSPQTPKFQTSPRISYNQRIRKPTAPWPIFSGSLLLALAATAPLRSADPPKTGQVPSFHATIAPVINAKCMPCHAQNGSGPFPLETYDQVRTRAQLVRYQALAKTMPPPNPQSPDGLYGFHQPLTDQELIDLQNWIRAGTPEGAADSKQSTPQIPGFRPDLTLKPLDPGITKDEGVRYWRIYQVPLPDKPLHLTGFKLDPQAKKAVRSATLAYLPPGARNPLPIETAGTLELPAVNLIGSWAPGYRPFRLPQGHAKTLPAGGTLLVQLQIQPTGKSESADFDLHLQTTPSPQTEANWLKLEKSGFEIPANASPTFELNHTLAEPALFAAVLPEARFYASQITLLATLPDGQELSLFHTQQWDPYWVGNYQPTNPVLLPKGTRLSARISYANDDRCAMNEDKDPTPVKDGPRLDQEVCRMNILLLPN